MATPRFSVVITCYNQSHYIANAIQSALSQFHPSREVIVVDDGSIDATQSILRSFGESICAITLEKNQGAPAARNAGTAAARGDYIVYLDGDDALKPWALSVYDLVITARQPVFILTNLTWFKGAVPCVTEADIPTQVRFVSYRNWIDKEREFRSSASALIVERETVHKIGGWKKEVWPFDDQYLAAELAYSGRAVLILDPTVFYRAHSANTIHNVPLLITGSHNYVSSLESNQRFRGRRRTLANAAFIGSPAFYAVRRAFQVGLHRDGLRLFKRSLPWIVAAALARARRVFVKRPVECLPLRVSQPPLADRAKSA